MDRREMYPALQDLSQKIRRAAAAGEDSMDFDCYYSVAKSFILPVSKETAGDLFSKLDRTLTLTKMLRTEGEEKLKTGVFELLQKWCSQFDTFLSLHSMGAKSARLLDVLQVMQQTLFQISAFLCGDTAKGQGCAVLLVGTLHSVFDTLMQVAVS